MHIDRQQLQTLVREETLSTLPPLLSRIERQYKHDGSIVTLADNAMQTAIGQRLAALFPAIPLLGEEMPRTQQQALLDSKQMFWCLDPIDGSNNLTMGLPFYSVSLALIDNQQACFGLVFDPCRDEMFAASRGQGAWLNDQPLTVQAANVSLPQTIALLDYKRLPITFASQLLQDKPYGSQRNLGSIALELCWLAAGRAHLYLHGNQRLWDYAAGDLILSEAGAYSSTLDGSKLHADSLDEHTAFAAIDQSLFEQWGAYLRTLSYDHP